MHSVCGSPWSWWRRFIIATQGQLQQHRELWFVRWTSWALLVMRLCKILLHFFFPVSLILKQNLYDISDFKKIKKFQISSYFNSRNRDLLSYPSMASETIPLQFWVVSSNYKSFVFLSHLQANFSRWGKLDNL